MVRRTIVNGLYKLGFKRLRKRDVMLVQEQELFKILVLTEYAGSGIPSMETLITTHDERLARKMFGEMQ
ncbi:hypothetical protein [Nonomuraea gerenzanensis]|nr:hypothetical protein [Nonomuraea gerenzanensis]UBU12934.1 hypothetical protein LCN96_53285 [Nonomuraea gerenzanensis]